VGRARQRNRKKFTWVADSHPEGNATPEPIFIKLGTPGGLVVNLGLKKIDVSGYPTDPKFLLPTLKILS
jgi:hypothetical protein